MKVKALVGSVRRRHAYYAIEHRLHNLKSPGILENEIVNLNEYHVGV